MKRFQSILISVLAFSCWQLKSMEIVRRIVSMNDQIIPENSSANRAIKQYLFENNPLPLKKILKASKDKNLLTKVFHLTVGTADADFMQFCLKLGADIHAQKEGGLNAFHIAAHLHDDKDVIKILIEAGLDVNQRDNLGKTPLFYAVYEGRVGMIKQLLKNGASPFICSYNEEYPLFIAWEKGNKMTVALLLRGIIDRTQQDTLQLNSQLVQDDSQDCSIQLRRLIISELLRVKTRVSIQNKDGVTPLIIACRYQLEGFTDCLLACGANPNLGMVQGLTPLFIAAQEGSTAVVRLLLRKGADINTRSWCNETPLMAAARNGKRDIVQLLIAHGAELDAANNCGFTALMLAICHGQRPVARTLLAEGAHAGMVTDKGVTALMACAVKKQNRLLKDLIFYGVPLNTKTKVGITALALAVGVRNVHAVVNLIDAGARLTATDSLGATPMRIAKKNGYHEIVKLLRDAGVCRVHSLSNEIHLDVQKLHVEALKAVTF